MQFLYPETAKMEQFCFDPDLVEKVRFWNQKVRKYCSFCIHASLNCIQKRKNGKISGYRNIRYGEISGSRKCRNGPQILYHKNCHDGRQLTVDRR